MNIKKFLHKIHNLVLSPLMISLLSETSSQISVSKFLSEVLPVHKPLFHNYQLTDKTPLGED